MKMIDKILDDLDEVFKGKKENEKYMYFFLPVLLFGFLSYQFLYPVTDASLKEQIDKQEDLKKKIHKVDRELSDLRIRNNKLPVAIKRDTNKYKKLLDEKERVDTLVRELDFLKFDIIKWGMIYNQIPQFAKLNHLVIENLDNEIFLNDKKEEAKKEADKKNKQKKNKRKKKKGKNNKTKVADTQTQPNLVSKKMSITITLNGKYIDMLKFLGQFENRKELVKVDEINSDLNKTTIKIDVFGANL